MGTLTGKCLLRQTRLLRQNAFAGKHALWANAFTGKRFEPVANGIRINIGRASFLLFCLDLFCVRIAVSFPLPAPFAAIQCSRQLPELSRCVCQFRVSFTNIVLISCTTILCRFRQFCTYAYIVQVLRIDRAHWSISYLSVMVRSGPMIVPHAHMHACC